MGKMRSLAKPCVQNVTRAMAAVASCFDFSGPRKRVVLTALEFTTSYPFWRSCERMGAEVVIVPSDDGVSVPTERVIAAIDERTLLAPLSHVYFRSGAVQDLGAICAAAHQKGTEGTMTPPQRGHPGPPPKKAPSIACRAWFPIVCL